MAKSLEAVAGLAAEQGDHPRAARLLGAAGAVQAAMEFPLEPAERAEFERGAWRLRARGAGRRLRCRRDRRPRA